VGSDHLGTVRPHTTRSGQQARARRARSARGLLGAALVLLAVAGVVSVQAIGAVDADDEGAAGPRPTAGAAVSGGLPEQVAPQAAPARTAPDVSVAPASAVTAAAVVTTVPTVPTATSVASTSPEDVTGIRDRRERAVSRDAHREARVTAAERRLQAVAEKAARNRTAALVQLAAAAKRRAAVVAANSWQLPVSSGAYHLTSRFGECSSLWSSCHTGLDFAAPDGTPIRSVAAGTVKEVGYAGAYGNQTIISAKDGTEVWYCHQSTTDVQPGQQVSAGQVIGAVGSTGNTTGPHLHLEVRPRPDDPVDPLSTLVSHGVHP
jgi:murein DD-endopeptidase MepM/ murein hydrolase activator NlpD